MSLPLPERERLARGAFWRWAERCNALMFQSAEAIGDGRPEAGRLVDDYGTSIGHLAELAEHLADLRAEARR